MSEYASAKLYIESATDLKARYNRLCQIIDALELMALGAASNQDIDEYWLDDAQTKIKTKYRSFTEVAASIENFEKLKQMCLNKLNGRVMSLKDAPSLNPRRRR